MATAEATGAAPTRRLPVPSARHVLVVLLAIGAAVANLAVLRSADRTVDVLVVSEPVPAGAAITAEALGVDAVAVGGDTLTALVTVDDLPTVAGLVATRPLTPGEPLLAGDAIAPGGGAGFRSMSLPLTADAAVGGALVPGDRVDVIAVLDDGARFLASGLAVLAVPEDDGLGGTAFAPTVAVDPETALRVAEALENGTVHLVRSTGAAPVEVDGG